VTDNNSPLADLLATRDLPVLDGKADLMATQRLPVVHAAKSVAYHDGQPVTVTVTRPPKRPGGFIVNDIALWLAVAVILAIAAMATTSGLRNQTASTVQPSATESLTSSGVLVPSLSVRPAATYRGQPSRPGGTTTTEAATTTTTEAATTTTTTTRKATTTMTAQPATTTTTEAATTTTTEAATTTTVEQATLTSDTVGTTTTEPTSSTVPPTT